MRSTVPIISKDGAFVDGRVDYTAVPPKALFAEVLAANDVAATSAVLQQLLEQRLLILQAEPQTGSVKCVIQEVTTVMGAFCDALQRAHASLFERGIWETLSDDVDRLATQAANNRTRDDGGGGDGGDSHGDNDDRDRSDGGSGRNYHGGSSYSGGGGGNRRRTGTTHRGKEGGKKSYSGEKSGPQHSERRGNISTSGAPYDSSKEEYTVRPSQTSRWCCL